MIYTLFVRLLAKSKILHCLRAIFATLFRLLIHTLFKTNYYDIWTELVIDLNDEKY